MKTLLTINGSPRPNSNSARMLAAFEEELPNIYQEIYTDMQAVNDLERQQLQAEYQRYKDIADGIIIL